MLDMKERIACRIAKELKSGDVVNLGIGLPVKVAYFLPENVEVTFESENGFLGIATGSAITNPNPGPVGCWRPIFRYPARRLFF